MPTLSFTAHCAKGHDPVHFTDAASFEAHVMGEHGKRKPSYGGPAWCNPKPHAWKAPKAPKSTDALDAKLAKWSTAHDDDKQVAWLTHWGVLPYGEPLVGCEEVALPGLEVAA